MRWLRKLTPGTLATFAVILAGLWLCRAEPPLVRQVRNAVFDQFQRWQPRAYEAVPVRIIDIDAESLKRIGQWPWPRTVVADLVMRLQDAGAVAISFDMMFAEPDRTSPQAMAALWKATGDVRERLLTIPDHDAVLAQAFRRGGVVLGFAGQRDENAGPQALASARLPARHFRVVNAGEPSLPYLALFSSAETPLAVLEQAAAGVGSINFIPDTDGVVRRVPLLVRMRDQPLPSLVAETLRVGVKQRNYVVRTAKEANTGIEEVRIGDLVIPTTREGELWVHYSLPVAERTIPAWRILEGKMGQGSLDGHVVLIGTSAQGLMDLRANALGDIMPGVQAHAQALEQILTGKYLQRPTWGIGIEVLVIVLGGLLVGVVALTRRALVSAGVTAVVVLGVCVAAWLAFTQYGLLLDPARPGLIVAVTFLVGSIVRHVNSEREQRWVRDAFSRYVSPNRVDFLVNNPGQLELGGRRQECSFVFTDLENFTGLMEKMDPGAAVALLNAYLDRMVAIAFARGGTLDRIVGDAVAIMFSAPVPQADHRARAYHCAMEMQAFASAYSDGLKARGTAFGKTRIGVHTGEVIVGNFGGSTMFDYRALGDPVNTAARLEGANKYLGTTVCVSEATLSGVADAIARPIGRLVVKGKTQALQVYEPLTGARDAAYDAAFDLLRQASPQALPAFEQLARERPHDTLVALHCERLRAGAVDDQIRLDEK